ncbi:hypothetical protein [Paraburkholderia sp. EG304]|uniref:hypothetical protein n=1 Tax=Paraburkholderia sp. EG304 TaxID=3237015 RepID=UPI00397C1FB9
MLEIAYEELVDDFEANALAFPETTRPVSTASSAQVRRPLYRTSMRRWQPRRELLEPLWEVFGAELTAVDAQCAITDT